MLDGLSFPTLAGVARQSTVDFADGTASNASMVDGGDNRHRGDLGRHPPGANARQPGDGESSDDQFTSWGPWVNGLLTSALQEASILPGLNVATLPVSINYRDAASTVTVGQYTQIIGSGNVTVASNSTADAEGRQSTPMARSSARPWRS